MQFNETTNLVSYVSMKLVALPALQPPVANRISYGIRGRATGSFRSRTDPCLEPSSKNAGYRLS